MTWMWLDFGLLGLVQQIFRGERHRKALQASWILVEYLWEKNKTKQTKTNKPSKTKTTKTRKLLFLLRFIFSMLFLSCSVTNKVAHANCLFTYQSSVLSFHIMFWKSTPTAWFEVRWWTKDKEMELLSVIAQNLGATAKSELPREVWNHSMSTFDKEGLWTRP